MTDIVEVPAVTPLPQYPTPEMDDAAYNVAAYNTTKAYDGMIEELSAVAGATRTNALAGKEQADLAQQSAQSAGERLADVQIAVQGALAAANYLGEWSALTGAVAPPATATHLGRLWYVKQPIANVTTQAPALGSAYWGEVSRNDFTVLPAPAGDTNAIDRGMFRLSTATSNLVLPANPWHGMVVAAVNVSGAITPKISRNGKTILGDAEDFVLNVLGFQIVLQYDSASGDWMRVSGLTAFTPYSTNQPFAQANTWTATQAFSGLTVGGKTVAELIAAVAPEVGSGSTGWYEKYPDGRLECGITIAVTAGATIAASGMLNVGPWTYPVPALSTADMSIVGSYLDTNGRFIFSAPAATATEATRLQIFNPTSGALARPTYVSVRMKGRWK